MMPHFKHSFEPYFEIMFQRIVGYYTEPVYQLINASLAKILTFYNYGIKLYVTENNSKTLNALIKKLKACYKGKLDVGLYRMAYGLMPSQASSCPDAKQMYINGHFYYADKFAILTNGLDIIRHISFIDDDGFKASHPDLAVEKQTDFHPATFPSDSAFDSAEIYGILLKDCHFSMSLIPYTYNPRNESTLKKVGYNEYGYPTY